MAGNENTQPGNGKRKRTREEEEFILDLEGCEELVSDEEEDELFGDLDDEYSDGDGGDDDFLLEDGHAPRHEAPAPPPAGKGAPPPDVTTEFDLEALEAEYDDDVIELDEESFATNPEETPHFGDDGTSSTDEVDPFLNSQGMARSEAEFEFQNQGGAFGDAGDEWEGQATFDEDMLGMKPLTQQEMAARGGAVPGGAGEPETPPASDPFGYGQTPAAPQADASDEGPELEDFVLESDDDEDEFQQQDHVQFDAPPQFEEQPVAADSGMSFQGEPDLGFDGFDEEEPALGAAAGESTFGVPSDDEMAKKWGDLRILGQDGEESSPAELREDWDEPASDGFDAEAEYDEHDPIYGAPEESEQAEEYYDQEPDYTQFEDMHHDYAPESQDYGELSGAVIRPKRRSFVKRFVVFTVAATVLLVWGAIALVKLRPDLPLSSKLKDLFKLGAKQAAPMEVVRVERPSVATQIDVPELLAKSGTDTDPTTDPGTNPGNNHTTDPVVKNHTDPNPNTHPTPAGHRLTLAKGLSKLGRLGSGLFDNTMARGVGEVLSGMLPKRSPLNTGPNPNQNTDPGGAVAITNNNNTDPGNNTNNANDPIPVVPIGTEPDPGTNTNPDPGTNTVANNPGPAKPVVKKRGFSRWPAVVRGTQALAQLKNGNFFVGRVMKIREYALTIQLERGEISFEPDDLSKLIPVAKREMDILRGSPDGYVKLKNGNKFWATILEDLPNVVTIQTGGAKITLPKSQVSQVNKKSEGDIKLEDDWRNDELPTPVPTVDPGLEFDAQEPTIRVRIKTPATPPKGK